MRLRKQCRSSSQSEKSGSSKKAAATRKANAAKKAAAARKATATKKAAAAKREATKLAKKGIIKAPKSVGDMLLEFRRIKDKVIIMLLFVLL